jgi:membrane-bound lytic murein transglycosylase D
LRPFKIFNKVPAPVYKLIISFAFLLSALGVIRLFSFYGKVGSDDDQYQKYFKDHYRIYSVNVPHDLNFAGEPVPLQDFEVRERIDREFLVNTYWQSQTILLAKRSNRWLPIIAGILKRNDIPDDFKYLAVVESGFTQNVSSKGAAGFWQFIPSTAEAFGLTINEEIDERYHPEKATEAACKFFKQAYKQFGNWTLVAASFNLGTNGIQKQLDRQNVKSYYDLLLNEETGRYVFRVLAMKEILSNPQNYGFVLRKKDLYSPLPGKFTKVDSTISNLTLFAEQHGTNYKMLKYYNPWLRTDKLTNPDKKVYSIKIPHESVMNYKELLKEVETLNPEQPIQDTILPK